MVARSRAVVGAPAHAFTLHRLIEELSVESSHDQALDVALFTAARRLGLDVPLLHCEPAFADACRLSNRANRVIDELIKVERDDQPVSYSPGGLESTPLVVVKDTLAWDHESDGATVTAKLGQRQQTARDDSAVRAPPRYLQATLTADGEAAPTLVVQPARVYAVAVMIGEYDPAVLAVVNPIDEPPFAGAEVTCDVIVSEPSLLPEPVRGTIVLPPNGGSTVATFHIFTRLGVARLALRVTVLHRGRVLQSGIIQAAIDGVDKLEFVVEAAPRHRLGSLEHRQPFDVAFVASADEGGIAASADNVGYTKIDNAAMVKLTRVFGDSISAVAANPKNYRKLRDTGNVNLLRELAQHGACFHTQLSKHQKLGKNLAQAKSIQVVAASSDALLPIELAYDHPPPTDNRRCVRMPRMSSRAGSSFARRAASRSVRSPSGASTVSSSGRRTSPITTTCAPTSS